MSRGFASVLLLLVAVVLAGNRLVRAEDPPVDERLRQASARFFERFDVDGDGRLSRDEFPERFPFSRFDADGDGYVTAAEDLAFRVERERRRGSGGRPARPPLPAPAHADVSYGPHERNVLDLWPAESETPTPLVVYFHGGGFRGGDKRTLNRDLLQGLLDAGISVAAANYRLSGTAPFPAQMHDAARALQFLRHRAAEWNLDRDRIGATGGSAGAGISLWLGFHEDLAEPESEDPVARQSTRLSAMVVYAGQSSYDPRFIKELFHTTKVDAALIPFFGMSGPEDVDDPRFHPLFEEASPINHATSDDPPAYLFYPQANQPLPPDSPGGQHIHHPRFGEVLKEKLDDLGVECVVRYRAEVSGRAPIDEYVAFFVEKLGATAGG
ncbi:MAG: alpha/beta hydrolase fold domain-containing protein [Planctomycetota bacterium]|jgi:acetyl esterase/lipase